MLATSIEADSTQPSAPNPILTRRAPAAVGVFAIVGSFVGYLLANRRLWFFDDDWDFLLNRSLRHNTLHNLFAPHNEHWSTVPVLSYRVLYSVFGMHHYLVYEVPVLLLHAGSCVLMWVLLRRAGATPWAVAGAVVLVAVCGGGAADLGWDFQIGFIASVFFGLLAVLIVDTATFSRRRLIWTWIALVLSLMSSGIGIPMVIAAAVYAGLRHGWRAAWTTASVPAAVFVLWYAAYGRTGSTGDKATLTERLKSAQYIWQGLTNTWQTNTAVPSGGAVLLALIVLPVLIFGLRDNLGRLALALLAGEVGLLVLTSLTRVQFGTSQAEASRYVYISTMLTIVAAVFSTRGLVRWSRTRTGTHRPAPIVAAVVLLVVLTLVAMASDAHQFFSTREKLTQAGRTSILGAAALIREHATLVGCCPDSKYNPVATVAALSRPDVLSALPDLALTPAQEITARGQLQVVVRPGSAAAPMNGVVTMTATGKALDRTGVSCLSGTADSNHPVLVQDVAGNASVTVSTTGPVFTQLRYRGMTSPVSTWNAVDTGASTVTASQPGATVLVYTLAATPFTVCRA